MATTIDYQPYYKGVTYPSWDIPLARDGGSEDLTGVDLTTFKMVFHPASGADVIGAGTFSIKALFPAEVYYKPDPTDVASTFTGTLFIKAFFPPSGTNLDEVLWGPINLTISDS
jgi:hypothetical protein